MSVASDPSLRAAAPHEVPLCDATSAAHFPVAPEQRLPVPRSHRQRASVYAALGVATLLIGLRLLASALALPLELAGGAAAPTWMVEVTTASAAPGTALVYGREVGFHLIQVPAGDEATSDRRVIPARLAKGELHIVSLGFSSLRVLAAAPKGAPPMTLSATSPIITVYQTPDATGVRTGW